MNAQWIALEVTDTKSIAAAAATVEKQFGKLDVLVNNAGVISYEGDGAASTVGEVAIRSTFEVNVMGLIAVTQAFLPLVKKSNAGRIVNLSSIVGVWPSTPIRTRGFTISSSRRMT